MICFKVTTPLDKEIRVTKRYWEFIATVKHPVITSRVKEGEEIWRKS
jgi:intein/homing endonuclease